MDDLEGLILASLAERVTVVSEDTKQEVGEGQI